MTQVPTGSHLRTYLSMEIIKTSKRHPSIRKVCSEQTIMLHLCGSEKYATVLCFSLRGGDARVPAPSPIWGVERFLERSLMCWVMTG